MDSETETCKVSGSIGRPMFPASSSRPNSPRRAEAPECRMNLVQEATRNVLRGPRQKQPAQPAAPKDADEEFMIGPDRRDPEESWRRVVLRSLLVVRGGVVQATLSSLLTLNLNPIPGELPTTKLKLVMTKVSREELFSRPFLPESMKRTLTKEECSHRYIGTGGGKTFWFMCQNCPARWPRNNRDEQLEYYDGVQEQKVKFTHVWLRG